MPVRITAQEAARLHRTAQESRAGMQQRKRAGKRQRPAQRVTDGADTLYVHVKLLAPDLLTGCCREYRFHSVRKWRADLAWPLVRLLVEVDGGRWAAGGGRHGGDADYEKLNAATLGGWRVLRFTTRQVSHDPAGCVATIREALGR